MHAAKVVLVVAVLEVEVLEAVAEAVVVTGAKTTSFMCSGIMHMWPFPSALVVACDSDPWVVVVNIIDEQSVAIVVKFPCRPMALSSTATLPMFLTCTMTLVVFPETDSVRRLAVRLPWALCRSVSWTTSSH